MPGYIVLYTETRALPDREWHVKALPGSATDAVLGPLSANTTYYFKLQARNSNGFGPMSDVITYYTAAQSRGQSPQDTILFGDSFNRCKRKSEVP